MRCPPRRTTAIVLLLPLAGTAAGALPALDPITDRVITRAVVPDPVRRQGEVRLVNRGDATVVQTLLATKVLRRVVGEIRKKEAQNWPPESPGHADMLRYVEALATVAAELEAMAGDDDRRLHLLVEFVATADDGGIVIGEFEGEQEDGALEPRRVRGTTTVAVGRAYLLRNMRLILADAFDLEESEVDRLGPLGPAR